ncbi:MAG: hypothetical protein WB682_12620 [Candidatus Dormiibacterota bacterium]
MDRVELGLKRWPKPSLNVSRSRTVIGRFAGTVESTGPPTSLSTLRAASSGSNRSTGSSRRNRPSSTRIMAAAAVTGLDMDATRKIESRLTGRPPIDCAPITST